MFAPSHTFRNIISVFFVLAFISGILIAAQPAVAQASNVAYTDPNISVASGRSVSINLRDYASDGDNTISCSLRVGSITHALSSFSLGGTGNCVLSVTAKEFQGTNTVRLKFSSSGGAYLDDVITVIVGAASMITFEAPSGLTVETGQSITVNAADYASDGDYTISCGTATGVSSNISSISNTACSYQITAGSIIGAASFTVPYSSSGGATANGTISLFLSGSVVSLSAAGCTDGTLVNLTANPRVAGDDNDLAEDCQALVSAQTHWAAVTANMVFDTNHPLRTWGVGTTQKISTWAGVTITNKRVTGIDLSNKNISGTIPDLSKLSSLQTLNLGNNKLTGNMPDLTELTSLTTLSLANNLISGPISDVASLTNLTDLNLGGNSLSGQIPNLSTNLQKLYLARNQLTGNIPTALGNLTNLTVISLEHNQIKGTIPTQLGNLSLLQYLYLNNNRLSGSIPTQIASLSTLASPNGKLISFSLCNNYLIGSVPPNLRSGAILLSYPVSSGYDPVACQTASNIAFTAPTGLTTTTTTTTMDVSDYASDGEYVISCGTAESVSPLISNIVRTGCSYGVTLGSTPGMASFVIPYSSTGGASMKATISFSVSPQAQQVIPIPALSTTGCTDCLLYTSPSPRD